MNEDNHKVSKPSYSQIMKLRVLTMIVWGIGILVYIALMLYTESKGRPISPFVLFLPASVMVGFAAYASEQKCPSCGEKFYGIPIRFFYAKSCKNCGYDGESS